MSDRFNPTATRAESCGTSEGNRLMSEGETERSRSAPGPRSVGSGVAQSDRDGQIEVVEQTTRMGRPTTSPEFPLGTRAIVNGVPYVYVYMAKQGEQRGQDKQLSREPHKLQDRVRLPGPLPSIFGLPVVEVSDLPGGNMEFGQFNEYIVPIARVGVQRIKR